jgi:D-glycero-alpha-D-manno-heptose-7-phosphate kinase
MIISRTPFRMSFIGGGSDLEAFYQKKTGHVLSTSINKYMYISIHPYFYDHKILLKYSQTELVEDLKNIRHPIFRVVLQKFDINGIEIDSIADIPHSTGLGSSSAFTVGLLQSLYAYIGKYVSNEQLAREACDIEINQLGEPIGKQDQYASSFGGLNFFSFYNDGSVSVEPVIIPHGKKADLERNLMLFFTGITRPASSILSEQKKKIQQSQQTFDMISQMTEMANDLRIKLCSGDIDCLGEILHQGWLLKQQITQYISNDHVSHYYNLARKNGAIGGKLLGAGGGGFLLFYTYPDAQERVRRALCDLQETKLYFDNGGSKIIYVGEQL